MDNGIIIMIVAGIIAYVLFSLAWFSLFGTRSRRTTKATRNAHEGFKTRMSLSSIRVRNQRFRAISQALNFIPIGRLTPAKKEEINKKLATVHKSDNTIRIAEEIHVMSWAYTGLYLIFIIILMIFWRGFGMLILGCPIVFKMPMASISFSMMDEEEMLQTEFLNFFSVYYVQYKRVQTRIRLADVVQSYKNLAPEEMAAFVSRIEVDLASGEAHALKMLDQRYKHNVDIHQFCSIASAVSRGDSKSDRVIESFQETLQRRDLNRRRKIVQKRMELVEKVQSGMLYTLVTILLVVSFIFTADF